MPVKIKTYLQERGINPSMQRVAVMHYLLNNFTHPTVDEIHSNLSSSIPTLSKTTVYNTLKVLVDNGAALQLTIDEKNTRYDGNTTPHAHFICLCCGCVHDVEPIKLDEVSLSKYKNLRITETQVYYKGFCEKCYQQKLLSEVENRNK